MVMGTQGTVLAVSEPHGSQRKAEIQLQGATLWQEVGKGCHKEVWTQKQNEGGGGQPSQGSPMHQQALGREEALRWPLTAQTEHSGLLTDVLTVMTFSHRFPFRVPAILQCFCSHSFFCVSLQHFFLPPDPTSPIRSTTLVTSSVFVFPLLVSLLMYPFGFPFSSQLEKTICKTNQEKNKCCHQIGCFRVPFLSYKLVAKGSSHMGYTYALCISTVQGGILRQAFSLANPRS